MLQYSEMNHIWSHLFLKTEGKVCFIVTVVEKKAAFSTYFQPVIIPLRYRNLYYYITETKVFII